MNDISKNTETEEVWDSPEDIYGIIEQPKDEDVVFKLDYDKDFRYLKLNSFTIQTFQFESNADTVFGEIFELEGEVKTITVTKPAKADVIVNNIAMPIKLRNAMFTTGSNGTRLQIHTVITKGRAKKFGVREDEIRTYIDKCRDTHYKLRDINKRK